jgi:DNA-binding NarL/FixJ family response regulator
MEFQKLTIRQKEIAKLIAYGLSDKEIIKKLVIEQSTLSTHLNNAYSSLGINTKGEHSRPRVLLALTYWKAHLDELVKLDMKRIDNI